MSMWRVVAVVLFFFGFGWGIIGLFGIYFTLTAPSQGGVSLPWASIAAGFLILSGVALYGGLRSWRKSTIPPPPRRIVREPTITPKPSVTAQPETGPHAAAREQAASFAEALKGVVEYSNIVINDPIPEETLKKYGWQRLASSMNYTIDDEPLVANLSKLVSMGPVTVPLLKSTILSMAASARSSHQFHNAGQLCLVLGKIGGKDACDALRSLFLTRSNAYEYQYIRGHAALGLALAKDKDAGELLFNFRRKAPPGEEAQYGWIAPQLDEALTMLGVELPETWDRVATQFISAMRLGTPDFSEFASRLRKFGVEEVGGAWNQVASEYLQRGNKLMAQRCWLEGLYVNPSPNFVAAWSHIDLPPGAPRNIETVERLRKELGSLIE